MVNDEMSIEDILCRDKAFSSGENVEQNPVILWLAPKPTKSQLVLLPKGILLLTNH